MHTGISRTNALFVILVLILEYSTAATTVNPADAKPANDPKIADVSVPADATVDSNGAGTPADASPGATGFQRDTSMSATSIVDFTGNRNRVSDTVDIGTSGIINEIVGSNARSEAPDNTANKKLITLEEANADNDVLYLKPDLCSACSKEMTLHNYCFLPHDVDCRKYVQCSLQSKSWTAYNRMCGFGTFWSTSANSCQFPDKVNCPNDVCRNPGLESYESGTTNCRAYWECKSGVSEPKCCPKYFSYKNKKCTEDKNCTVECPDPCLKSWIKWYPGKDNCRHYFDCVEKKSQSLCCPDGYAFQNGRCVENSSCDSPCPEGATIVKVEQSVHNLDNPDCDYIPVDGGKKYQLKTGKDKTEMKCAGVLLFNVKDCVCNWPTPDQKQDEAAKRECNYDVCIDFEKEQVTNIDELNIKKRLGIGVFNGSSAMGISIYKGNDRFMNKIALSLLFKSQPNTGPARQVLISNCRTKNVEGVLPSFAIVTDKGATAGDNKIVFLVQDRDDKKASIIFSYKAGQWTSVKFSYDGEKMMATTHAYNYQTKEKTDRQHNFKIFKGMLRKGKESLKVGRCLNSDGFVGEMDDTCSTLIPIVTYIDVAGVAYEVGDAYSSRAPDLISNMSCQPMLTQVCLGADKCLMVS